MKRIIILIVLFLTLTISCRKNREVEFEINYKTAFTLNSSIGIDLPFSPPTPDINTNSVNEFHLNNTKSSLVREIKLKSLKLTITNPKGKTFSFVKSVRIYISAPGLPEIEGISLDTIPNDIGNELIFSDEINKKSIKDIYLEEYIFSEKFSLRTETIFKEIILQNIDISVDINLDVKADAFSLY